ncbi:MAG: prephenate dehydratase, partial [Chloroflexi bacterium]|nr:prephenate dehydratase [Chloroflexota bacterium]
MRLSYLGPPGTFSEEAAVRFAPHAELVPLPTITASAVAVLSGEADVAVA